MVYFGMPAWFTSIFVLAQHAHEVTVVYSYMRK